MIMHRFIALDFMNERLIHIDESGRHVNWTVPSGDKLADIQLAGNGQLLVSRNDGWALHDLTDGSVCSRIHVKGLSGLATLRLLPDATLLGGINTQQGIEIWRMSADGGVLKTYPLPQFRDVRQLRRTAWGTVLLAHHDGGAEIELGESDCIVHRTFTAPEVRYAYQLSCTANGNFRLSGGYSKSNIEFSPEGRVLGEFSSEQPEGMQSFFYSGFQTLSNGNLMQANWNGHGDYDYVHGLKLFEFDCGGRVVWSWCAPKEHVGSILTFIVLDGLDVALAHDDATGALCPQKL